MLSSTNKGGKEGGGKKKGKPSEEGGGEKKKGGPAPPALLCLLSGEGFRLPWLWGERKRGEKKKKKGESGLTRKKGRKKK